jgi:hypothetical protein
MEVPIDALPDAVRQVRGRLSLNDERHSQFDAAVLQARMVFESAKLQKASGDEMARMTKALVRTTQRLFWATAALALSTLVLVFVTAFASR